MDPLKPDVQLLCLLASVVAHADEYHRSPNAHDYDLVALKSALEDDRVQKWLKGMRNLALAPVPR